MASDLPPDVAGRIHPARVANETAYWSARDGLLGEYRGIWIGYADSKVVASGRSPVAVMAAGEGTGLFPFLVCVGRESEPDRVRRVCFPYDTSYPGEPLPVTSVEFRRAAGVPGILLDHVIPDTGADVSVLPWADCLAMGLDPALGQRGQIGGVGGTRSTTLSFLVWARLDGQDIACRLQADFAGDERIIGRDVLNQLDVLFRGPSGEVVVGP